MQIRGPNFGTSKGHRKADIRPYDCVPAAGVNKVGSPPSLAHYSVARFSITCQRSHRHCRHQPNVRGRPAPPCLMPYFPHGSVNPHFKQRITQPGARRSYSSRVSDGLLTPTPSKFRSVLQASKGGHPTSPPPPATFSTRPNALLLCSAAWLPAPDQNCLSIRPSRSIRYSTKRVLVPRPIPAPAYPLLHQLVPSHRIPPPCQIFFSIGPNLTRTNLHPPTYTSPAACPLASIRLGGGSLASEYPGAQKNTSQDVFSAPTTPLSTPQALTQTNLTSTPLPIPHVVPRWLPVVQKWSIGGPKWSPTGPQVDPPATTNNGQPFLHSSP